MAEYDIQQVAFTEGGLVVQYAELPTDVRARGRLVMGHQLSISAAHPDYREDIEALYRKTQRLLANALEDFEEAEPYTPEDEDDDEIKGMGDH